MKMRRCLGCGRRRPIAKLNDDTMSCSLYGTRCWISSWRMKGLVPTCRAGAKKAAHDARTASWAEHYKRERKWALHRAREAMRAAGDPP